jgi:hypothetical protein
MKLWLGLGLLGAGMFAVFYYSGAFYSASAECEKTMAEMKECTTMAEVLAVAEPHKVSIYENFPYTLSSGATVDDWKPGPEIDFKRATIEQQVKDGTLAGGLAFIYIYSNADSFEVKFDATGNVVYVQEQEGIRGMPGN